MSRNQISGAISLDVSGVAAAVKEELQPTLGDIRQQIALVIAMVAPVVLDQASLADALARAGAANPQELARHLTRQGYRLLDPLADDPEPVTAEPATEPVMSAWLGQGVHQ